MDASRSSKALGATTYRVARRCTCAGRSVAQIRELQVEHELEVFAEGSLFMRMACTPDRLAELVSGRLLTEGHVASAADIAGVFLSADGRVAHVAFRTGFRPLAGVPQAIATHGGLTTEVTASSLVAVPKVEWRPSWVYALADRFGFDTPMHKRTHGAHSCYLARRDKILYCCEDLGRHNAFDKAVGCAMRDGVSLAESIVYTSGRVPVDMMAKAVRAGIPVVVSNAMPTDRAVEMAVEYGVTLACRARPDSMLVFNDPASACGFDPCLGEGFEVLKPNFVAS